MIYIRIALLEDRKTGYKFTYHLSLDRAQSITAE